MSRPRGDFRRLGSQTDRRTALATVRIAVFAAGMLVAALPAHAEEDNPVFRESLAALYRLEYESALEKLQSEISRHPTEPAAYLYDAGVLCWWETTDPGVFDSSPTLKGRFLRDLDKAIELSNRRLDSPHIVDRADALFIAGLAYGIRAQWKLTGKHWLGAYFDGRKGKKLLQKCLQLDPEYYDAYLGIGLYEYYADRLPAVLKIGAILFIRGDAERGKEYLRLATDKGRHRFATSQAASNLVTLLVQYERSYGDALSLTRRLLKDYPDSPYFRFIEVVLLDRLGSLLESHDRARELFRLSQSDMDAWHRRQMSILCGLAPQQCLETKTLRSAVEWLTRAIDADQAGPPGWEALCRLYRGLANDLLGERAQAVSDFQRILSLSDISGSHAAAKQCLQNRCRRKAVEAILRGLILSRTEPDAVLP